MVEVSPVTLKNNILTSSSKQSCQHIETETAADKGEVDGGAIFFSDPHLLFHSTTTVVGGCLQVCFPLTGLPWKHTAVLCIFTEAGPTNLWWYQFSSSSISDEFNLYNFTMSSYVLLDVKQY